jgi:murein DD-endopeptidase MepM/ murein hydrolase activator NlpD
VNRIVASLAALVLLMGQPAYADPRSDKDRVDHQLAEAAATLEAATDRARSAAELHASAVAQLPGAETAAADAKGRAIGAEVTARAAQRDSDRARQEHEVADSGYDDAAAQVDQERGKTSKFIAATYKGSGFTMVNLLLDARSPSELATTIGYLDHIAGEQKAALDKLTRARMEAKQRADALYLARRKAEETADAARRAYDSAKVAQLAAEQATVNVKTLIAQSAAAEQVAAEERTAVLAQYAELQQESDRIAAQLRGMKPERKPGGGGTVNPPSPGAFFLMPVHGWKSSNYGMRYDPYYHVYQLHAGVDLAAAGGSPILAAETGKVVRAGWAGGYGNYTCVYHGEYQGKGLATCYGHQSKIEVSVGQWVARGEEIGRVGTTGASTGYHLHFEVRLDGSPVQPLNWLPGCLC